MKYMIDTGDKSIHEALRRISLGTQEEHFFALMDRGGKEAKERIKTLQYWVDNRMLTLGYLIDNQVFREEYDRTVRIAEKLAKIRSLFEDFIDDMSKLQNTGGSQ
ncbi:hypothetical protein RU50_001301 [Salmonella enterica subsp. enterica]|nr:hypothetical protein [Salmonella enterica subsp. enterica]